MAATDIATEVVKSIARTIIAGVVQQIKDVVELEENLQFLQTDFTRMEVFLRYIDDRFQEQQRRLPEPVELCLTRMNDALTQAKQLAERAKQQRRRCFGCCLLCSPKLTTEVRNWETRFGQHFQDLQHDFSITANAEHIVSTAAPQAEVLRQDVPDDIVGSAIGSAQVKLQTWLTEPAHNQSGVIGIYGIGGVGKTTVLKAIHDNYKKVSGIFDIVIWFTVSNYKPEKEDDKIKELQASIAHTLNVDLKDCPNDIRKMKLSASLKKKRFLIILDDMWRKMDLDKVGVKFGHDKGSKVLISSRRVGVIKTMGASAHYCWRMRHLSAGDGWELFRRKAFANGAVPEDIKTIAEEIAKECKGLPLALNVVAAVVLSWGMDLIKWRDALASMRNVDAKLVS
jgi:predicted adenine nucleotide alpha hydrolase (AANH) superfamily ATPase